MILDETSRIEDDPDAARSKLWGDPGQETA